MDSSNYISVEVTTRIPFQDADPMGVTWHGNYLRYLETARCALLERLQYDYRQMSESGFAWPIVEAKLKYVKSSTFGEAIRVKASLVEYENRLKVGYVVRAAGSDEVLVKAHTVQVAVEMRTGEMCFVSPQVFLDKVAQCAR